MKAIEEQPISGYFRPSARLWERPNLRLYEAALGNRTEPDGIFKSLETMLAAFIAGLLAFGRTSPFFRGERFDMITASGQWRWMFIDGCSDKCIIVAEWIIIGTMAGNLRAARLRTKGDEPYFHGHMVIGGLLLTAITMAPVSYWIFRFGFENGKSPDLDNVPPTLLVPVVLAITFIRSLVGGLLPAPMIASQLGLWGNLKRSHQLLRGNRLRIAFLQTFGVAAVLGGCGVAYAVALYFMAGGPLVFFPGLAIVIAIVAVPYEWTQLNLASVCSQLEASATAG